MAQQPPVGQGLITWASRSHSDTPHWVGLFWTSNQLVAVTSTSQQTDIHAAGEIRTHYPRKRAAADQRLRPRGHRDRLKIYNVSYK